MKKINKENWNKIDPLCEAMLVATLETGSVDPMFPGYWLDSLLEPQLSEDVSDQMKSLFETARGVMVYGYFYYPLFAVGSEQLFRLCEAAIIEKYARSGGPDRIGKKSYLTLDDRINWLRENGVLDDDDWAAFKNLRLARNEASHAKAQSIHPPSTSAAILGIVAERINKLFSRVEK